MTLIQEKMSLLFSKVSEKRTTGSREGVIMMLKEKHFISDMLHFYQKCMEKYVTDNSHYG